MPTAITPPAPSATIAYLDRSGLVGYDTSIAIGADGLGLISYYNATNDDLKIAHCSNTACSSATTATVDTWARSVCTPPSPSAPTASASSATTTTPTTTSRSPTSGSVCHEIARQTSVSAPRGCRPSPSARSSLPSRSTPKPARCPASHATIQEAADDPACATVTLAAQTYPESIVIRRSLTLAGPGTGGAVVQGLVLIAGATTEVTLNDLRVENGCVPDALRTSGGARLTGNNLQVERSDGLPCPLTADTIFTDGFESGNTTAWSSTTP